MTEKNKAKICSNAIKARVKLDGLKIHLDRCEDAADFDSPESVIVRNIKANIAEAYRDLEILINRNNHQPISAI